MAIPISHEECWNRLQRLGVEHQAMKYELDESAAELDRLRAINAELLESVSGDRARRIAACLNACRDISTEDLEMCCEEEVAFHRNWMMRQIVQNAMFSIGDAAEGE